MGGGLTVLRVLHLCFMGVKHALTRMYIDYSLLCFMCFTK